MAIIAPSILSANFGNLNQDLKMINKSQADWIHIDIMDGIFVPNISFGFPIIKVVNKISEKKKDIHLMIQNPEKYIYKLKKLNIDIITIHFEGLIHLHRIIKLIQKYNIQVGVAINPHTSIKMLEDIILDIDLVLLMSVNPGFSGQKFINNTYNKLIKLKELILKKNASTLIEIDGGVTLENAKKLINYGADILVIGTAIFKNDNPIEFINNIKKYK